MVVSLDDWVGVGDKVLVEVYIGVKVKVGVFVEVGTGVFEEVFVAVLVIVLVRVAVAVGVKVAVKLEVGVAVNPIIVATAPFSEAPEKLIAPFALEPVKSTEGLKLSV